MDIWERMYEKAKEQYHPEEVSPFIYAHNVVCAIEAENGDIYTGFCIESCSGVMNICADRLAALNMYANSGQTKIKRFIAFRDSAPNVQSAEEPIFFNWLMMRLPYSSFHSQHFSKKPSLPRSFLSIPCFFKESITFTSVAMAAWSVPGCHNALYPCILL